ncbi:hypothetical protein Dda_6718 [Drechslerella dactyloides]|uniref:F-box domain-containing protein n=1 Tax=Drechslerella dactyloides TaxID=74499 RepID=A0AAD6NHN5_DREDA|nr:hypothetical protein Dda_6718 [Drechslerella dactyloides]
MSLKKLRLLEISADENCLAMLYALLDESEYLRELELSFIRPFEMQLKQRCTKLGPRDRSTRAPGDCGIVRTDLQEFVYDHVYSRFTQPWRSLTSISLSRISLDERLCQLFRTGSLKAITFRYCGNWKALRDRMKHGMQEPDWSSARLILTLSSFHVVAYDSELPYIKDIMSYLDPCLQTLILMINYQHHELILKHSATLQRLALHDQRRGGRMIAEDRGWPVINPIVKRCDLTELSICVRMDGEPKDYRSAMDSDYEAQYSAPGEPITAEEPSFSILERFPAEITALVTKTLDRKDIASLVRCNHHLSAIYLPHLYGRVILTTLNPCRNRCTPDYFPGNFSHSISPESLKHIKHLSILGQRSWMWQRKRYPVGFYTHCLCNLQAKRYTELCMIAHRVAGHHGLITFEWMTEYASLPNYWQVIFNFNQNLVNFSLNLSKTNAGIFSKSSFEISCPSLRRLRIHEITRDIRGVMVTYGFLTRASSLMEIDLAFIGHDFVYVHDTASCEWATEEFGPVSTPRELLLPGIYNPISRFTNLRSLSLSHMPIIPEFAYIIQREALQSLTLRWCNGWKGLSEFIEEQPEFEMTKLKLFHAVVDDLELGFVMDILEAIPPGLQTLILMVRAHTEARYSVLCHENVDHDDPYRNFQRETIYKHAETLKHLAWHEVQGYHEEKVAIFHKDWLYLYPALDVCDFSSLSVVVLVTTWYDLMMTTGDLFTDQSDVPKLRYLLQKNIRVLHLIPNIWHSSFERTDANPVIGNLPGRVAGAVDRLVNDVFSANTARPKLEYVIVGFPGRQCEMLMPIEWCYNVTAGKWVGLIPHPISLQDWIAGSDDAEHFPLCDATFVATEDMEIYPMTRGFL